MKICSIRNISVGNMAINVIKTDLEFKGAGV